MLSPILIIEDEPPAARRLQRMMEAQWPGVKVSATCASIAESVSYLQQNPPPALIMMDIELSDGRSFEIFSQTSVQSPVVFTTAYDDFALEAFRVHGMGYLLKPIREEELDSVLTHLMQRLPQHATDSPTISQDLKAMLEGLGVQVRQTPVRDYRTRFLLRFGDRFVPLQVEDIAWFSAEEKLVFAQTLSGQRYPLDQTLDLLEQELDPRHFFRLNRGLVANHASVTRIHAHFNGRLKLNLEPDAGEVFVSRERASAFKAWMGG